MGPSDWKLHLGDSAWAHIMSAAAGLKSGAGLDDLVADVLTAATEVGLDAPELPVKPHVVDGRRVVWPLAGGRVAGLTAAGLEHEWLGKGHGWVLLRVRQLCRAVNGPLLSALQVVLLAYETQCARDGVDPILARRVNMTWFVGGDVGDLADFDTSEGILSHLADECPEPRPVERAHAAGAAGE